MGHELKSDRRRGWFRAVSLGVTMVVTIACADGDRLGPTAVADPVGGSDNEAAATLSGIVFASSALTVSQINAVHTGLVEAPTPSGLLSFLSQVRAKGGRVLIKLAGGESTYKNPDGTFNLTKWQSGVDRYRNLDFSSYVADGTIVGHFLVDEPHFASRWGDKGIPQTTVEAAAKHSKQRWPNMPTLVNAPANWLASVPVTYVHLDAGWAMFRAKTSHLGGPSGQPGEVEGAGPRCGTQCAGRGRWVQRPPRHPTQDVGDERRGAQEVRVSAALPELRVRLLHVAVQRDVLQSGRREERDGRSLRSGQEPHQDIVPPVRSVASRS